MSNDPTRLRLKQVIDLRHAALPDPLRKVEENDLRAAAQRCLTCTRKAQCDELLAAKAAAGFDRFCPNFGYIERLHKARFSPRRA